MTSNEDKLMDVDKILKLCFSDPVFMKTFSLLRDKGMEEKLEEFVKTKNLNKLRKSQLIVIIQIFDYELNMAKWGAKIDSKEKKTRHLMESPENRRN